MENIANWYLMGLIVFLQLLSYFERKALLNRLMARDLSELSKFEKPQAKKEPHRIEL